MSDPQTLSIAEAQRHFAIEANIATWQLIEKTSRDSDDTYRMLCAAYTSCYHWLAIGKSVHAQRSYWLLSHIYALLQQNNEAQYYADKCLALSKIEKIETFDYAYCYEALSRVAKLQNNEDEAHAYRQLALDFADEIADNEDKNIFMTDLNRQ